MDSANGLGRRHWDEVERQDMFDVFSLALMTLLLLDRFLLSH
jgi:hypothetical protein